MHQSGLPFAIQPEREIHTHANMVLLMGDYAYKLKKPVKFPFLDFSTLEHRREMVLNELQLNRRFAPTHYLGVCEITRNGDVLIFGPLRETLPPLHEGVIDYCVVMRRIAETDWLPIRIRDGRIKEAAIKALVTHLLEAYAKCPADMAIREAGMPDQLRRNTVANIEECREFIPDFLSQEMWQRLHGLLRDWFVVHPEVFEKRVKEDRIREVHGDLKPGNIAFVDGRPVVTDCIEFNPQLRRLDILCDISFLATGLEAMGAFAMASHLYEVYQAQSGDDYPLTLRRYYQAHLACVMGKVTALQCREEEVPLSQRQKASPLARHYFALADLYARAPHVIVVMGIMGCGKSTVAEALAEKLGWPVKNSDVERKRLAGVVPTQRLPKSAYSTEMSEGTYHALFAAVAGTFPGIILDAQFPSLNVRKQLRETVASCGGQALFVLCDAPDSVVHNRMTRRETDNKHISDATADLLPQARKQFELPEEGEGLCLVTVDTREAPDENAERIIEVLLGDDYNAELAMV